VGAGQPSRAGHESFSVAVDVVIGTLWEGRLHLLLVQRRKPPFAGTWALPGGFVGPGETLKDAARRELLEETGIQGLSLVQFRAFGDPERDPRGRVLSVAYLALVDRARLLPRAGSDAQGVGLFPMDALPVLAFDHERIIRSAHEFLCWALWCSALAADLLPPVFPLSQLRAVYAQLLGEPRPPGAFRRMLGPQGVLEEAGRAGRRRLYRFRTEASRWLQADCAR